MARLEGLFDCATWFTGVTAVVEPAMAAERPEFDETVRNLFWAELPQPVFPDAGGIEQASVFGQVIENRRGRRVASLPGGMR